MLRFAALAALVVPLAAHAQHAGHGTAGPPAGTATPSTALILGRIDVRTSATGAAAREIETGMLALHSFWYEEARDHFTAAQRLDAGAALAYWGEAATHDHPLWSQHDSTAGRAVFARLDSVRAAGTLRATARETATVDALRALFAPGTALSVRRDRYAEATARLAAADPTDDEAAVFAALAEMSRDVFDLNTAASVVPVAAGLEDVVLRNPEHPGAVHYLIHAYDSPAFARLGLRPARAYAALAPASSHALHMPSHIFSELGMWAEKEASNRVAWEASVAWQERTGRPVSARDYHALAWLLDALLAQGRFADARAVLAVAEADAALAAQRGEAPGYPAATALSLPAAYLRTARVAGLPGVAFPVPDGLDVAATEPRALYGLALRAALSGQDEVLAAIVAAGAVATRDAPPSVASTAAADVAFLNALRLHAHGDARAFEAAREAIRLDVEANPTDAPTSPAHVLLADLLLARGDAAGSLAMYRAMAAAYPNRANTALGIARASAATGDTAAARVAYAALLQTWTRADAGLPAADEARAYLAAQLAP